jgi:uncharacterized membrane protein YciS (DUF1049 family)
MEDILMKKLIALIALVGIMVLTFSFTTLGASQVYFDYIVDGEWEEGDLTGFVFGLNYKNDLYKFGIDYLTGEIEKEVDYTQMSLKGGYGITDNVFVTLSMFDGSAEEAGVEISANGFLLGADLSYDFSDQLSFEGSFGISLVGEIEASISGYGSASEDADIMIFNLKLIYNVSDSVGVSFSYNDFSVDPESGGGSLDGNYITIGAAYKF